VANATGIHAVTAWHSLLSLSHFRNAIVPPYGVSTLSRERYGFTLPGMTTFLNCQKSKATRFFGQTGRWPKPPAKSNRIEASLRFDGHPSPYWDPTYRECRSIKGQSQEKNFPGDWKERKCSLRFPAHVMLRGFGGFCFLSIHSVFVTTLSDSEARQAAWLKRVNHGSI